MKTQCHRHDLKMCRNGNCDAKHHGNASAGTMVRLQLVFHGQGKQKQSTKHTKKKTKQRLVTNEVRTRSERGTKRGQKLPGTDPYPNPGAGRFSASASSCSGIRSSKNEKNKYRTKQRARGIRSSKNEKNKYRSNPNGDKMIP